MGVARRLCESASPSVYLTGLCCFKQRVYRRRKFPDSVRKRFHSRSWRACCLQPQCTQPTKQATDKPLTVVGALAWHQGLLLLTGPNAPGLVAKSISIDSAHNEDDRKSEWSGRAYEEAHRSLAP